MESENEQEFESTKVYLNVCSPFKMEALKKLSFTMEPDHKPPLGRPINLTSLYSWQNSVLFISVFS